jgi:hypothetical protein
MSKNKPKNFRFSTDTCDMLDAVAATTGYKQSRIAELAVHCYAMEIGVEVSRAQQFLAANLMQRISNHRVHGVRLPGSHVPRSHHSHEHRTT